MVYYFCVRSAGNRRGNLDKSYQAWYVRLWVAAGSKPWNSLAVLTSVERPVVAVAVWREAEAMGGIVLMVWVDAVTVGGVNGNRGGLKGKGKGKGKGSQLSLHAGSYLRRPNWQSLHRC